MPAPSATKVRIQEKLSEMVNGFCGAISIENADDASFGDVAASRLEARCVKLKLDTGIATRPSPTDEDVSSKTTAKCAKTLVRITFSPRQRCCAR